MNPSFSRTPRRRLNRPFGPATNSAARAATAILAASSTFLLTPGCIGPRSSASGSLRARDFAATAAEADETRSATPPTTTPSPLGSGPSERTGPVAASGGMFDVTGLVGEPAPALSGYEPAPTQAPVLVDGVVGYINNRAIYISDFLAPMEQRLRAEARKLPREKWIQFCRERIQYELNAFIEDELLRAEALSSLSTEQRQGLFNYIRQLQNDFVSKSYGSRAATEEMFRTKEGISTAAGLTPEDAALARGAENLEEWTKAKEEQELITFQLAKQIYRRLNVSWRDIQLGYEKQFDAFNPPPAAQFRLIRVEKKQTEKIEAIRRALDSGADFADTAASPDNTYKPDEAGLMRRPFDKDYAVTEFFGVPILNDKAHALRPGEWTGPFDVDSSVFWLKLERIDRRSMDLYDAQLTIERDLQNKRAQEARARYIDRLKQRASFTNIDEMTERLVRITVERYLPPTSPPAGG